MLERPDHPKHAFAYMDVMRTLAAALVAVSHVRDLLWRDAAPGDPAAWKAFYLLTGFGHIGVVVFFVLSGFWITRSVMKRLDQPSFWPGYLIDRISRLWIVLLPVLLIGGTLDWLGVHYWQWPNYLGASGAHSLGGPIAADLGLSQLLGSLFFLAKIAVHPLGSNGPLWSLAYEFWYYLWFPALALLIFKRRLSPALLFLAVGLLSGDMVLGFVSWLAGSALHFILHRLRGRPVARWERIGLVPSLLVLLALLAIARVAQTEWLDPVLALGFAIFLFFLCRTNLRFPRVLAPVGAFGSNSSFSLYALHYPLAMALVGWTAGGIRAEPSGGLLLHTLAIMAALVIIAFLFSRLTEVRTDKLRRMLKNALLAKPAVAAAATSDLG